MGKVADAVKALVQPIAEGMGLYVLEVLYEKKYDGMNLTVVIDKEGGVTINDCEALHNAIDAPLDELDPIQGSYTLNVSSPGLDRPLKLDWDYKRNLGKKYPCGCTSRWRAKRTTRACWFLTTATPLR